MKFLLPKVTNIIKILIIILKKNNEREFKSINSKNTEVDATRLPSNKRRSLIIFFNILLVPYNKIKSKKKLRINTKSK